MGEETREGRERLEDSTYENRKLPFTLKAVVETLLGEWWVAARFSSRLAKGGMDVVGQGWHSFYFYIDHWFYLSSFVVQVVLNI